MSTEEVKILLAITSSPSTPRQTLTLSKSSTTAKELREQASTLTNIPLDKLKLIFKGRIIIEKNTGSVATDFGLEEDCVVHCVGKPVASAPVVAAAAAVAPPAASGATVSIPTTTPSTATTTTTEGNTLSQALATLASTQSSTPSTHLTALQTLSKLLSNITSNPMEEKYRKVKKSNAAFQRRLGGLEGGHALMLSIGFVVKMEGDEEMYVMEASPEAWNTLVKNTAVIKGEMEVVQRRVNAAAAPPPAVAPVVPPMPPMPGFGGMPGGMGGMGGMPGGGLPPNMTPGMQDAVASMMSNPEALRGMLQVSTVFV
uniref:Ubiquitin-like domain-containing protein n=1 Tax=Ditylum brightwellii TaxID=49249 RepID=A0A7S4R6Y6_9STRA